MRFSKMARLTVSLIASALVFCLFPKTASARGTVVRLTFTGDCTIGGEDRLEGKDYSFHGYVRKYGYGYPFANFRDFFLQDDLTIVNFEGVLLDDAKGRADKPINFRGPADYAMILPGSGVEAAFLGNNHMMDYGERGFLSTANALEKAGVAWFGDSAMGSKPHILEKNGVKIGFVGCYASYWITNVADLRATIQGLKDAGCDAIVAVMHGGAEYSPYRDKRQARMAAWLAREGANLVIGHHPHVIQGVDVLNGVSVVYSLGNFAFGGNKDVTAVHAIIARAELHFDEKGSYLGHRLNLIPVSPSGETDFNNYQPVFLSGAEAEKALELAQRDTLFELAPYVEGVGAWQDFVPAPAPAAEPAP